MTSDNFSDDPRSRPDRARLAAARAAAGDTLRARYLEEGVPYFVEGDEEGQLVFRPVETMELLSPEEVAALHARWARRRETGSPDVPNN